MRERIMECLLNEVYHKIPTDVDVKQKREPASSWSKGRNEFRPI